MEKTTLVRILSLLFLLGSCVGVSAEVNVDVNARLPVRTMPGQPPPPLAAPGLSAPELLMETPPQLIYSQDLGYYVAVDTPYEMVFIDNSYYLHRNGRWFVSPVYDSGWVMVQLLSIPEGLRRHDWVSIRQFRDREYNVYRRDPGHYQGRFYDHRPTGHHAAPRAAQHALPLNGENIVPRAERHGAIRSEDREAAQPFGNRPLPKAPAPRAAARHGEVPPVPTAAESRVVPRAESRVVPRGELRPVRAEAPSAPREAGARAMVAPTAFRSSVTRNSPVLSGQRPVRQEAREAARTPVVRPTASIPAPARSASVAPKPASAAYKPSGPASKHYEPVPKAPAPLHKTPSPATKVSVVSTKPAAPKAATPKMVQTKKSIGL